MCNPLDSMDTMITYNEVAALCSNLPSIAPRPNFTNLHNLRRHIQCALQRLSCPKSNMLGWAGLIMARPVYALLTMSPFRLPTDLGPMGVYYPPPMPIIDGLCAPVLNAAGQPTFVAQPNITQAEQAAVEAHFSHARNYWLSYMNIQRAVHNVPNDNINDTFKVLNDPSLDGWNLAMEHCNVFDQIMTTYGGVQNDTLFRSVYFPQDTPEVLFCCIEHCQEVQILGDDPYTPQQLLNNAVHLFLQCGLYTSDFEDWDEKLPAEKFRTNLKTFVQECLRQLNASSITAGSQGYVQNAFAVRISTHGYL